MTQLGEAVSVGMIMDEDFECPFSHDKPGNVENDLDSSSSKLGTRLENGTSTRLWEEESSQVKQKEHKSKSDAVKKTDAIPLPHEVHVALDHLGNTEIYPFSVSAHHLIPGEASLPKSSLLHYIKGGKIISSDIGYAVNGRENGVWLPTHHAFSAKMPVLPFETKKVSYKSISSEGNEIVGSLVNKYTDTVMEHTNRQFHDDHTSATDYSNFVIKVLNKIQTNLATIKNFVCEKCMKAKAAGGKLPPPYRLVYRLNSVSKRLNGYLLGSPLDWHPPIFTSPHARSFAENSVKLKLRGKI